MRRAVLVLLALVLALPACGDDAGEAEDAGTAGPGDGGADPTEPAPAGDDPLAGRTLVVAAAEGRDLVAGTTVTLAFADGQLSVEAGCNHISGAYSVEGDALAVDGLTTTEMGCDPARMEQDAWIAGFLGDRPTVGGTSDEVSLAAGGTVLTLVEQGEGPATPLVGTTWTLDTLVDGETASSVPADVVATLTFADDGTYALATGCNTGTGGFTEGDGTLEVERPTLTRRGCRGPAGEVEAAVLAVLGGTVDVVVDGRRLTLAAADGHGLGFTAP